MSQVFIVLIFVTLLMMCELGRRARHARRELLSELRRRRDELQKEVNSYRKRFEMVKGLAVDYRNSMSPETTQQLSEVRNILLGLNHLLEDISLLMRQGDHGNISRARLLMLSHTAANELECQEYLRQELRGWRMRLEMGLRHVSREILAVMDQRKEFPLPQDPQTRLRVEELRSITLK